jgi:hypothetical protein
MPLQSYLKATITSITLLFVVASGEGELQAARQRKEKQRERRTDTIKNQSPAHVAFALEVGMPFASVMLAMGRRRRKYPNPLPPFILRGVCATILYSIGNLLQSCFFDTSTCDVIMKVKKYEVYN